MPDLIGILTDWASRGRRALGEIADVAESVPSSSIRIIEFLVVAIMAPILVVLVAWLGIALGLSLLLSLVVATTTGLVPVLPFMLRSMQYSTHPRNGVTLSIAPMLPAPDAPNSSATQDYEGLSGLMTNSTSLNDLSEDQLELISELLGAYQEGSDLSQPEWATVESALDIVDARLEEI